MFFPNMGDSSMIYGAMLAVVGTMLVISWAGITKIRHFVIHFTQFCAVFSLTLSATAGAIFGFTVGRATAGDFIGGIFAAAAGAFLFFAVAAIPFSLLLLLTDISINTRGRSDMQINHVRTDLGVDVKPKATPVAAKLKAAFPPGVGRG